MGRGGGLTEPTHGRELRAQLIPPLMGRGVVSGVVCRGRPPVFRQPAGQMIDPGANLHGDQPRNRQPNIARLLLTPIYADRERKEQKKKKPQQPCTRRQRMFVSPSRPVESRQFD